MTAPVYNLKGEKIGEIELPEDIFNIQPKKHVLWEFVSIPLKPKAGNAQGENQGGGHRFQKKDLAPEAYG